MHWSLVYLVDHCLMRKYWLLIQATLQEYLVYRLNFFLWRVRAVLQLAILFFLWTTVYQHHTTIFGYSHAQIMTYVLGISLIRSYILAAHLSEGVGAEIVTGNLTNTLLKPISYLRYVFVKDLSDKLINVGFSSVEVLAIVWLFRPPLTFQTHPLYLLATFVSILIALSLYFFANLLISSTAFWLVEDWWAPRFVFGILLDFLAGGLFPIDILPAFFAKFLLYLPFPYILFFPMKVYLGQLPLVDVAIGLLVGSAWLIIAYLSQQIVWHLGLRRYEAAGR